MDDAITPLMLRVAQGDRRAFAALYSASAPKLFGVLMRILGNRAEAEDALQEVFIKIWTRAARFDPEKGQGMSWAITIARHHAIDRIRARPAPMGDDDALALVADPAPRSETRLMAKGEAARIDTCINALEPRHGAALRGAYLAGQSYEALALAFDVPINTMRTWLRRGLLAVRECMGQ